MSRIGKKPIPRARRRQGQRRRAATITVEGKLGQARSTRHRPEIDVKVDDDKKPWSCSRSSTIAQIRAYHGLTRALISNMVDGVTKGYEKKLEIQGVGYLARSRATRCSCASASPTKCTRRFPKGLTVTCPDQTHIVIKGTDKQQVGQFAAEVRAVRKPEPYKGKGIRYDGEQVRRKAGKTAT